MLNLDFEQLDITTEDVSFDEVGGMPTFHHFPPYPMPSRACPSVSKAFVLIAEGY
jgi:hypothetical protein